MATRASNNGYGKITPKSESKTKVHTPPVRPVAGNPSQGTKHAPPTQNGSGSASLATSTSKRSGDQIKPRNGVPERGKPATTSGAHPDPRRNNPVRQPGGSETSRHIPDGARPKSPGWAAS